MNACNRNLGFSYGWIVYWNANIFDDNCPGIDDDDDNSDGDGEGGYKDGDGGYTDEGNWIDTFETLGCVGDIEYGNIWFCIIITFWIIIIIFEFNHYLILYDYFNK